MEKAPLKAIAKGKWGTREPGRLPRTTGSPPDHHPWPVREEGVPDRGVGPPHVSPAPSGPSPAGPDAGLRSWLFEYAKVHPWWGYRRAHRDARAYVWTVNLKKTHPSMT